VSLLGDALRQTKARFVIVDPIQSYLGAEVDAHRANETRPVLDGLSCLAEEHDCCILLVRHLSKAPTVLPQLEMEKAFVR
jgi:RecA-family ATPase